jgi:hypothetical protein
MIGVLHVYTEEIKEMGLLTTQNKRDYCEKHGYKFIEYTQRKDLDLSVTIPNSRFMEPRMIPIGWSKIELLKRVLLENKDIDWLFWIDADALFMNYNKKLESFVNDKSFFIVGQDCNGINVGTFFIKNCERSIQFLDDIWNDGPTIGSWWTETEQGQIDLHGRSEKYFDGFWVVSNKLFNAYIHDCSPGLMPCSKYVHNEDFIIHLPGQPNKIHLLTNLLKIVIK